MKKLIVVSIVAGLLVGSFVLSRGQGSSESFSAYVDQNGNITLPEGYRTNWAHLGVWVVTDAENGYEFHDVYTEPSSLEAFKANQRFPDGATLVKEIRNSISARMTTGEVSWANEIKIWFVMVKDDENRFPNNPLWGDGWGWALFQADNPAQTVTKDYKQECISCHIPAQDNDWVYLEGYPELSGFRLSDSGASAGDIPPAGDRESEGTDLIVNIEGLAFNPNVLTVKVGSTVTWINHDKFAHTATADDGSFDTGSIGTGERASITFDKAGKYRYHCTPHPFMKGSIEVTE